MLLGGQVLQEKQQRGDFFSKTRYWPTSQASLQVDTMPWGYDEISSVSLRLLLGKVYTFTPLSGVCTCDGGEGSEQKSVLLAMVQSLEGVGSPAPNAFACAET